MLSKIETRINEYIELFESEDIPAVKLYTIERVLRSYAKSYTVISESDIHAFLIARYNPAVSTFTAYRRILLDFLFFYRNKKLPEEKKCRKKPPVVSFLEELAIAESYVDEKGVLRVKYSGVPAPFSWVTVLKGKVSFDVAKSRRARRDHTKECGEVYREILPQRRRKKNVSDEKRNQ